MKHKIFLFLLPMLAAAWLNSCHKDTPRPPSKPGPCLWPEITSEGVNTFGCKINGKEWVPCADIYALAAANRPIDASFTESNGLNALSLTGVYSMTSVDSTSNSYGIAFWPLHIGKIPSEELEHAFFTFSERHESQFIDRWELPISREGLQLEILRLDTAKNIISGTFEAVLLPKFGTDTLFITDGRFDVTYYQQ